MALPAIALDRLQPLEVDAEFPAKIALDDVLSVLDRVHDQRHLLFGQRLGTGRWIDSSLGQDDLGVHRTDAVDVAEGDVHPLVTRNINT